MVYQCYLNNECKDKQLTFYKIRKFTKLHIQSLNYRAYINTLFIYLEKHQENDCYNSVKQHKCSDIILQHYYNILCCLLQQLIISDVISDGHMTT